MDTMNIVEFNRPSVLFIKGVFIKDCIPIDDMFDARILERAKDELVYPDPFTPLPTIFYGFDTWPKTTNLRCYYCDRTFETTPFFIPKTIEPSKEGYTMSTEGCFCTFNCAVHHVDLYYQKIHDNLNKKNMIKLLYRVFHGVQVSEIPPSPSKYEMICYGGELSHQEYGKKMPKCQ
jgi:hypothetical protein